jgi:hypothetical protein
MSGFAPRASSAVSRMSGASGHGGQRLTAGVKWTTSDDDLDIAITMIGHGAAWVLSRVEQENRE